jgi:Flp pilus assembly protein TadG
LANVGETLNLQETSLPMIVAKPRIANRRATASVELAVLAWWILVPLLLGTWEVGRLIEVQQIVANAAREGGRQASTGIVTTANCKTAVLNYLTNAGLNATGAVVNVTNITAGGDVINASQLDHLQCTLQFPFNNAKWLAIDLIVPNNSTMNASSDWYCMKNIPLTVTTSIPTIPQ